MKQAVIGVIALVLAVMLWWFVRGQARVESRQQPAAPVAPAEIVPLPPAPRAESPDPGAGKPVPSASPAAKVQAPSTEQIREEVAANPEVTPLSLLDFAESLAPKMRDAIKDEGKAREFFDEMRVCVQAPPDNVAETAQALCLRNALKLGEIHPALRDQADKLRSVAAPRLLHLIQ